MEKHKSSTLPGFRIKNLGNIEKEEPGPTRRAAIEAATGMLEKAASAKRADVIMNYHTEVRETHEGFSCTASGFAAKKTKL